MKYITVKITKKDIKRGVRGSPGTCPIALALKRALPDANKLYVTPRNFYMDWGAPQNLPIRARRFIESFDLFGYGRPFRFRIAK